MSEPEIPNANEGTPPPATDPSAVPGVPLPFEGGRIPATPEELRSAERRVLVQFLLVPGLAFAALVAGFFLELRLLAGGGVAGLGLAALLVGALAVRERRLTYMRGGTMTLRTHRYYIYEGLAAVPFGLAYVVAGISLVAAGAVFMAGAGVHAIRDALLARPGLALTPLGLGFAFHGTGFVIGFGRRAKSVGDRVWIEFLHFPARLGGLILVAWGAGLLVLGLADLVAPAVFDGWVRGVFGNPWPFRDRWPR